MSRAPRPAAAGRTRRATARSADKDTAKDTGKDAGRTRASPERARARVTEVRHRGMGQRAKGRECAQARG